MLVSFSAARRTNNVSNRHLFSFSILFFTFLPSTCGPAPRRRVPPPLLQQPLPEHDGALRKLPEVGEEQLVLFPHRQQRRLHVSMVRCGHNWAFENGGRRCLHLPQPPHLIRGGDHGFVPAQFRKLLLRFWLRFDRVRYWFGLGLLCGPGVVSRSWPGMVVVGGISDDQHCGVHAAPFYLFPCRAPLRTATPVVPSVVPQQFLNFTHQIHQLTKQLH